MKLSEAILKGYEKVEGRQYRGGFYSGADERRPSAVCPLGAVNLAAFGHADTYLDWHMNERDRMQKRVDRFKSAWGISITHLNDEEKLPWEHIYGMAVAAGL